MSILQKKQKQLILETVTEKGNPSAVYRKLKEAYHNKNHVKEWTLMLM